MEKILLGYAAVDSGQLMVCDPCYIDSNWVKTEDLNIVRVYKHIASGNILEEGKDFKQFDEILVSYGLNMNQMIQNKQVTKLPYSPPKAPFSYEAACKKTLTTNGGQLNFPTGHKGAGVVFTSGWGDGMYPVYGYINEEGRVAKVEIELIEE